MSHLYREAACGSMHAPLRLVLDPRSCYAPGRNSMEAEDASMKRLTLMNLGRMGLLMLCAACGSTNPPAAQAPTSESATTTGAETAARSYTLAELKQLSRADLEREWSAHGVTAIPTGCSRDAVEITYDAAGAPTDTTKPIWTGKCIDATTKIPANILNGVRKDASDKPAALKPSFFDGKNAVVFEYPADWSLHLRELGDGLFVGRQAHAGQATGVVYIVGRFEP
jgi:hypothetical protein